MIEKKSVLLIYHKKLQKWLPPGGHIDPNEIPHEAAIREAREETGLEVEILPQENYWISPKWNGKSIYRPYHILLENIPEHKGVAAHEHIDLVYLGKIVGGTLKHEVTEVEQARWFTQDSLQHLIVDKDIFEETVEVISHLMG